jgi:PBSX family phage terminase large subunit
MNEIEVVIPKSVYLPCYRHLNTSKADINFLWGGRDSGKSHYIAQRLIRKCLKASYFRCIMVKKTGNSIEASQWQTVKDIVEEWGLSSLFVFKKAPLSIECINGNRFIARGCDDAANLKSIKDPTDVWYEELNQLELHDFVTVASTLRSNKADVEQWGSFNPEAAGDYEEFWLYKTFFANYSGDIYQNFTSTWTIDLPKGIKYEFTYTSTHTTYYDNPHCKPARQAFLEQLAVIDPYYYKVFTLGKWGNIQVGDPFCLTFVKAKHVGPTTLNRNYDVNLSFDFNVNPITCQVFQDYNNRIYGIESIKLDNSDIYKLCDYIILKYHGCLFVVTGDATGKGTTALVQDGINYYTVIKTKLNLSITQIKVPTVNPKVKDNRVLVNAVFSLCNITLDPVGCKGLIFDCENVSVNDMGEIDKGDRSNPKKRADHLDGFRYYLNTFHKSILKT